MAENEEVTVVAEAERLVESLGTKVIGVACQDGGEQHFLCLGYGMEEELARYALSPCLGNYGNAVHIILSGMCLGIHTFHIKGDEFAEHGKGADAHLHVVVGGIRHYGTKGRAVGVLGNGGVPPGVESIVRAYGIGEQFKPAPVLPANMFGIPFHDVIAQCLHYHKGNESCVGYGRFANYHS